jgi:hypothetical protein
MAPSPSEILPEVLKNVRTRPLFRLRERVPPLYVVGQTPNAFRRIGVITGRLSVRGAQQYDCLPLRGVEEQAVLRRQPRLDPVSREREGVSESSI